MSEEIRFEVAGISTALKLNDEHLFYRLDEAYQEFKTNKPAEISIKISLTENSIDPEAVLTDQEYLPFGISFLNDRMSIASEEFAGYLDLTSYKAEVAINSLWPLESLDNFLRNVHSYLIIRSNGLILHASGVVREGMAYIFFGPSGSGKSTVARLSAPYPVLSDDMVVIKRTNGTYKVFGTPYWADMQANKGISGCFEIKGLFKLIKDEEVYLERITQPQAVAEVLSVPNVPDKVQVIRQLFEMASGLIEHVPCYGMHFLPEPSFWQCIEENIDG